MIVVFTFVIFPFLPLLHSATPSCPNAFTCPNLTPFKYPFYNATNDTSCGLIKVNCTSNGAAFQHEGSSYEILQKNDSNSSFMIRNTTFRKLVKNESCDALMNNITSPGPLFSISIHPLITIFKCRRDSSYAIQETETYFNKLNFNSYKNCSNHNFYYMHPLNKTTVPTNFSHRCQVIQLPVKRPWQLKNQITAETNIFSLLTPRFSISFSLSDSCQECNKNGRRCESTYNGDVQCIYTKKEKQGKKLTLILVLVGFVFILMLGSVIFIIRRLYKRKQFPYFSSNHNSTILEDECLSCGVSVFSYTELENATEKFDPAHELGDGGFGTVYYGKLEDGREIAVKRLYEHNYKRLQHFINEVDILTRLRHPNLVVLYGSTSRESRELLLVYEYIPNGTVAEHLHGERANQTLLTWQIRMNIAIETASALVYLHASEIIHRDVKTSNILVDHNFSVKVADFGLSRLIPNDVSHVSTAPQGTPGYVDPQYNQRYQLTDKSDVYSFGVVLIELISSMPAVDLRRSEDEISLANFALNRIQKSDTDQLIDPVLESDSNEETKNMIRSVAELAFQCLQYDSNMRPTMNEVLDVLTGIQSTKTINSFENFDSVNPPPSSEANDKVVLIKDFLPSPVSVTSES